MTYFYELYVPLSLSVVYYALYELSNPKGNMQEKLYSLLGTVYPYIFPIINPFIQSRVARRSLATLSSIYIVYLAYSAAKKYGRRRHLDIKRQRHQQEVKEAFQCLQERVKVGEILYLSTLIS